MAATRRQVRARRVRRMALVAPVGVVLLVAGCGGGSGGGGLYGGGSSAPSSAGPTPSSSAASGSTGATASGPGGTATVEVGSTSLGKVLTDGSGRTLYMYDEDTKGGPSTCYDGCASAWPPLLTSGAATGAGVDDGKLGTTKRNDGTTQVTYAGWPLYYWAQDAKPGDVNGQGVSGVWWVLTADGQPDHG